MKVSFDIDRVLALLEQEVKTLHVPVVDLIAVQTKDPYKVLAATILSARTKDETTAKAAARLFEKAPNLPALRNLDEAAVAKLIYPVGFYKTKAKHLLQLPNVLAAKFDGRIPDSVEALIELPGVGRKTANLVVAVAFGKPAICVDTHVHRIMNIWGYVRTRTPFETEMALRNKLPEKYWRRINSVLVAFGQAVCKPVRPHCDRCAVEKWCPQLGVTPRRVPGGRAGDVGSVGQLEGLKFVSWNVNGLRAAVQKGFLESFRAMAPDILAVQEVKAMAEQLPDDVKQVDGYSSFWFPAERKGYSGVGVYTRRKPLAVHYGMGIDEHDQEGRVLTLEFHDYYFVNVYFPNAGQGLVRLDYKLRFNNDFLEYADRLRKKKPVVICGDFNVAHKEIDIANPKQNEKNAGFTPEEREWMGKFIAAGYVDTFRLFNRQSGQYSWWSYRFNARERNIGWRIDYFCVDLQGEKHVRDASILPDIMGSDHCPVELIFNQALAGAR